MGIGMATPARASQSEQHSAKVCPWAASWDRDGREHLEALSIIASSVRGASRGAVLHCHMPVSPRGPMREGQPDWRMRRASSRSPMSAHGQAHENRASQGDDVCSRTAAGDHAHLGGSQPPLLQNRRNQVVSWTDARGHLRARSNAASSHGGVHGNGSHAADVAAIHSTVCPWTDRMGTGRCTTDRASPWARSISTSARSSFGIGPEIGLGTRRRARLCGRATSSLHADWHATTRRAPTPIRSRRSGDVFLETTACRDTWGFAFPTLPWGGPGDLT